MSDLHVESLGDGPPVVLVHGSFGTGAGTFAGQKALAEDHRLMLVDRRGFGQSPAGNDVGWKTDCEDLVALLEGLGGAHLVGHSYGGVVCLLAAGARADLVGSVVAIEPPAFEVAAGDAQAAAVAEQSRAVAERAGQLSTEDYVREWGATVGQSRFEVAAWTEGFSDADWAAADASRRERWAGNAPIPFDALAAAPFPKVLARGGWNPEVVGRKAKVGAAFGAVCQAISDRIGGEVVTFGESTHNPQREEAAAFNDLLRRTWSAAA
jgi:pimeloyl-ACP methyl ester carboxylesterase